MRKFASAGANLVLTATVLYYAAGQLDLVQMVATLVNANHKLLALAFASYFLNYLARALRFRLLLTAHQAPFMRHLAATQVHGAVNYFLPARLGELSYPWLAHRVVGVSLGSGALALLLARLLDLAVIAFLVVIVLVVQHAILPGWLESVLVAFVIVSGVALGGMLVVFRQSWRFPDGRAGHILRRIRQALREGWAGPRRLSLVGLSLTAWMATLGNFYLITLALDFDVTVAHVVLISVIALPLSLLPFHGVANVGAHEVAWTVAFQVLGDSHGTALSAAVGSHIVLLVMVALLGMCGLTLAWLVGKPSRPEPGFSRGDEGAGGEL